LLLEQLQLVLEQLEQLVPVQQLDVLVLQLVVLEVLQLQELLAAASWPRSRSYSSSTSNVSVSSCSNS
jgi:hypothetical protein